MDGTQECVAMPALRRRTCRVHCQCQCASTTRTFQSSEVVLYTNTTVVWLKMTQELNPGPDSVAVTGTVTVPLPVAGSHWLRPGRAGTVSARGGRPGATQAGTGIPGRVTAAPAVVKCQCIIVVLQSSRRRCQRLPLALQWHRRSLSLARA